MRVLFWATAIAATAGSLTFGQPPSAAEIPFRYRAGWLWVEVTAGAAERLNFLVDTGAVASVIDRETARRLGVKLAGSVAVRGVGTQTTGRWTAPVTVRTGDVTLAQKFLAVALHQLSGACEPHVDGLLGADFFRSRIVQIDYGAEKLRILGGAPGGRALPLRIRGGALCVPVAVNGSQARWVRLDTGCASALQWVTQAQPTLPARNPVAVGLTEICAPVTPTTVTLGGERLEAVPTGWHAREIFAGEAGLLGNGLLSGYTVTVDAAGGRVVLEKR